MVTQIDGECAVGGSIQTFMKKVLYNTKTGFFYSYDVKFVTIEEPFLVLYRTLIMKKKVLLSVHGSIYHFLY